MSTDAIDEPTYAGLRPAEEIDRTSNGWGNQVIAVITVTSIGITRSVGLTKQELSQLRLAAGLLLTNEGQE
jgi:hypothetical protein